MTSKLSPAEVEFFTSMERSFETDTPKVWLAQRRVAAATVSQADIERGITAYADEIEHEFFRDEAEARARFAEMAALDNTVHACLAYGAWGAMDTIDSFGDWDVA